MEVLHKMMDQVERQRLSKMMDEMPDHVTMQQRHVHRFQRALRSTLAIEIIFRLFVCLSVFNAREL